VLLVITFSKLGQYGRLGNQLFQYALIKSVSIETGYELQLPKLNDRVWHGQACLLDHFKLSHSPLSRSPRFTYNEKNAQQFDEGVFKVQPDTDFFGFFQHKDYFSKHREILLEEFKPSISIQNQAKDFISNLENPTSIHFRRGDYVEMNQGHPDYESLVLKYVQECVSDLPENTDFLVFTGGSRNGNSDRVRDFDWCKDNLKERKFHFVENNSEILDFELIKNCKNNITGWDSTFSWWASYLNNEGGKIYYNKSYQKLNLYEDMKNWIEVL